MTLEELIDIVKTLIRRNDTEKAIKKIIIWAKENYQDELENEISVLSADLAELNRNKRLALLPNDQIRISQNRINFGVLDLLESVEDRNSVQESSNSNEPNSKGTTPKDIFQGKATSIGESKDKPDFGAISYGIPSKMQVDNLHRCTIRIAFDKKVLMENIPSNRDIPVIKDNIRLGRKMSATFSPSDSFSITAINDDEQLIDEYGFTEWNFDVRPLKTGKFPLSFKVSIIFEDGVKQVVLTESVIVGIEPTDSGMEWKSDTITDDKEEDSKEDTLSNNSTSKEIKILMLTANPVSTAKLKLKEEYSAITEKLQNKQDLFNIIYKKAVSASEFQEYTYINKPDILHFSGHGIDGKYAGIKVEGEDKNEPDLITSAGLDALFEYFQMYFNIKVVILNACIRKNKLLRSLNM